MRARNTPDSYGAIARLLHWSVVLLIILQYVLAESAHDLPDGTEKLQLILRHKSFGVLILLLVLARIAWKVANKGLPVPAGSPGLRKAAAAGHGILYLLLLAVPLSGWAMSASAGYPVSFFGLFELPALVAENHELHEALEELHEGLFVTLVVVSVGHVLAALYHQFVLKDGVLRRMI